MGAESKAKLVRRYQRRIRSELDKAGVTERGRQAFLGLRREDVQAAIRAKVSEELPLSERPTFDAVAREALAEFGYDLTGITLSVRYRPGKYAYKGVELVQEPPTMVFVADASEEAVEAARLAAGIKGSVSNPQLFN